MTPSDWAPVNPSTPKPAEGTKRHVAPSDWAPVHTSAPPVSGASMPDVPKRSAADRYAGWDVPGTSAIPKYSGRDFSVPLEDDPRKEYGAVLPFARNKMSGALELAVPEMLRAPIRGIIEGGQEARGLRPVNDPAARSDITAAVSTFGGARAGVGEPRPGAVSPPPSSIKPVALEARQAGYVLPPQSITETPGVVANALAGWSGKIKTQQAASAKNQEITNGLAQDALGVPRGTPLMPEVFNKVRAEAGKAYQAVVNSIPTIDARNDQIFRDAIDNIGGHNSQAAAAFPRITANPGIKELVDELRGAEEHPTGAWVELVKELRFNANANLKSIGDPSKHALGLAQREAANAVDDLMDRKIEAAGQPGLIDVYRQARRLIAKAYDVEGATNVATGDVNARGLAKLADNGRPLTDQLKLIANAAAAFPKAMQPPASFGDNEPLSALDFFGSAGALLHGNPGIAAAIMGRPAARSAVLSNPIQNRIVGGALQSAQPAPPLQIFPLPYQQQPDPATAATSGMPR